MGSFFYETDEILFSGSFSHDPRSQRILAYHLSPSELPEEERVAYYREGTDEEEKYSVYGFKVGLEAVENFACEHLISAH